VRDLQIHIKFLYLIFYFHSLALDKKKRKTILHNLKNWGETNTDPVETSKEAEETPKGPEVKSEVDCPVPAEDSSSSSQSLPEITTGAKAEEGPVTKQDTAPVPLTSAIELPKIPNLLVRRLSTSKEAQNPSPTVPSTLVVKKGMSLLHCMLERKPPSSSVPFTINSPPLVGETKKNDETKELPDIVFEGEVLPKVSIPLAKSAPNRPVVVNVIPPLTVAGKS
jgi:hypothetical protein